MAGIGLLGAVGRIVGVPNIWHDVRRHAVTFPLALVDLPHHLGEAVAVEGTDRVFQPGEAGLDGQVGSGQGQAAADVPEQQPGSLINPVLAAWSWGMVDRSREVNNPPTTAMVLIEHDYLERRRTPGVDNQVVTTPMVMVISSRPMSGHASAESP